MQFSLVQDGRSLDKAQDHLMLQQGTSLLDESNDMMTAFDRSRPATALAVGASGAGTGFTPRRPMTAGDPIGPRRNDTPGPGSYRVDAADRLRFSRPRATTIHKSVSRLDSVNLTGIYLPPSQSEKPSSKLRGYDHYRKARVLTTGGQDPKLLDETAGLGPGRYIVKTSATSHHRRVRGGRWSSQFTRDAGTKPPEEEMRLEDLGPGRYRAAEAQDKLQGRRYNHAMSFGTTPRFVGWRPNTQDPRLPAFLADRPTTAVAGVSPRKASRSPRKFVTENIVELRDMRQANLDKREDRKHKLESRQKAAKQRRLAIQRRDARRSEAILEAAETRVRRVTQRKWLMIIAMVGPTTRLMQAMKLRKMQIFKRLRLAADKQWMHTVFDEWVDTFIMRKENAARTYLRRCMRRSVKRRVESKRVRSANMVRGFLLEMKKVNGIVKAINRYYQMLVRLKSWWVDRQAIALAREAMLLQQFDVTYERMQVAFLRKTYNAGLQSAVLHLSQEAAPQVPRRRRGSIAGVGASTVSATPVRRGRRASIAGVGAASVGLSPTAGNGAPGHVKSATMATPYSMEMNKALHAIEARRVADAKFPEIPLAQRVEWVRKHIRLRSQRFTNERRAYKQALIDHRESTRERLRLEEAKLVMTQGSLSRTDEERLKHFVVHESRPRPPVYRAMLTVKEAKRFVRRCLKEFLAGEDSESAKMALEAVKASGRESADLSESKPLSFAIDRGGASHAGHGGLKRMALTDPIESSDLIVRAERHTSTVPMAKASSFRLATSALIL